MEGWLVEEASTSSEDEQFENLGGSTMGPQCKIAQDEEEEL